MASMYAYNKTDAEEQKLKSKQFTFNGKQETLQILIQKQT